MMESEKPLLASEDIRPASDDLPRPITARPDLRRRLEVTRRIILFALVSFFALWHIRSFLEGANHSPRRHAAIQAVDPTDAYLTGIVDKGTRKALCGKKASKNGHLHLEKNHKHHDDDNKHHGDNHRHHDHPDRDRKGMRSIPPKVAEKLFLSVPNNDSCRE